MKKFVAIFVLVGFVVIIGATSEKRKRPVDMKEKLSEWGLFAGKIQDLVPVKGIVPYDLCTPLFTDYAYKSRFVKVPEGQKVKYNAQTVLDFPVGTILIKNFYYKNDERNDAKGRKIMETRLLIKGEDGWDALPYFWNDEQTEAFLEVAGNEKDISWKDMKGKTVSLHYGSPNINQCKGCHNYDEAMMPIGPSARQLNKEFAYADGKANQLQKWKALGILTGLPDDFSKVDKAAEWQNEQFSLQDRARAYLDINCGHCHSLHGPANTSGYYLNFYEKDTSRYGIYKTPVAAGKGSGGHLFDVVPGKPNESILVYRMESLDPGEMMPELGRHVAHKEGVELIKSWIASMKPEEYEKFKK